MGPNRAFFRTHWKGLVKSGAYIFSLLKEAFSEWRRDDASLLSASLAFYGVFSLTSLLILILIFISLLIHHGLLAVGAGDQALQLAGQHVPAAADGVINQAASKAASFRFTLASALILMVGAAGLFVQTKRAFAIIWSQEQKETLVLGTVRSYARSFMLMALVCMVLLLAGLANGVLLPLSRMVEDMLPVHLGLIRLVTIASSLLFVAALFAVAYKTLSDVDLKWKDLGLGAAIASLLFALGNAIIESVVGIIDFGSAYGAASSLVIFLIWIYYSAQIFLFGAELIKVHKRRNVSRQT
ncbi:MAG: YihY/virulence factor BrkB family protein [Methanotrichaceae archaeon]|nr:YihY/virulence factor BrkB family protein [Methanotrichaceae archaeon]